MDQRVVAALCCLFAATANPSAAGDTVYVAYDTDGSPRFSTQPYDNGYSVFLRNLPSAQGKAVGTKSAQSLQDRKTAIAPYIAQTAQQYGMNSALLAAVVEVESGFNPKAISPKGAMGAMQLIPSTAADYGVTNPYDLQQNLDGGARYLRDLIVAHNGNLPLALAAYNSGKNRVAKHNQRIPPIQETMLYVPRVLARMEEFQRNQYGTWQ